MHKSGVIKEIYRQKVERKDISRKRRGANELKGLNQDHVNIHGTARIDRSPIM